MAPHNAESQSRASALHELYSTTTHTRRLLTTVTTPNNPSTQEGSSTAVDHDFLTLITTVCDVYRSYVGELYPMQAFNKDSELVEDGGTTCVVSSRAISTKAASSVERGRTEAVWEKIIVKRTRKGVLEPRSSAMRSFIAELRVRSHMPLRLHPNIVDLKGVAWDYEEGESRVPRPLLLEEFATERSLTHFWGTRNLTRMPFKVKAELCLDVAHGISILHECGVVHGDIKPDNILIFPRGNSRYETFTAKLTDFGHSAFEFEDLRALPAFTKQYCAPEADPEHNSSVNLTFDGMKQTDVYSFGLVVLSVVTGGSFLESFDDKLYSRKGKDEMARAAMDLVEKQDRENNDSDFDLDVLDTIFNSTVVLTPSHRSLRRCLRVLESYREMQKPVPVPENTRDLWHGSKELKSMNPNELSIGYHTMSQCSHPLKQKIQSSLLQVAADDDDPRSALACWELAICYFAGFGVDQDFAQSCQWLVEAAAKGVFVAQTYFVQLHEAMFPDSNPVASLLHSEKTSANSESAAEALISDWLYAGAEAGCFEILPNLESRDPERYSLARQKLRTSFTTNTHTSDAGLVPLTSFENEANVMSENDEHILGPDIVAAASSGDLSSMLQLIENSPQAVNHRDVNGETVLMHALRSSDCRCANALLSLPHIDASIQNRNDQDALHLIFNLTDEEAKGLIPAMVEKGAKTTAQAAASAPHGQRLDLTPRPQSCPVLLSVLYNRIPILESLLEASHMPGMQRQCRICDTGSRYRKILAFAISLHRADALEAILRHLKKENEGFNSDLSAIEVWVGKELLHVWSLAIKPPPAAGLDLPESFVRALHYGRSYESVLSRILSQIWQSITEFLPVGYVQLQEAVVEQNLEVIDFLVAEGSRRGIPSKDWWLISSTLDIRQSPLFLSVQLGHRSVFRKLVSIAPNAFCQLHLIPCCIKECDDCQKPFDYSTIGKLLAYIFLFHRKLEHSVNLAQTILALATVSPHQDVYFVNFLLENSSAKLLTSDPARFDERFSRQPSSFLAQAILANAFQAADAIQTRFPALLEQQIVISLSNKERDLDRSDKSGSYTSASKSIVLRYSWGSSRLPLRLYVLLVGSYQSCAYLFRNLHKSRSRMLRRSSKIASEASRAETATLHWSELTLGQEEFHMLLVGLIKDNKPDRYPLWEVIASQLERGQPRRWKYFVMALYYANTKALEELLRLGWNANGGSLLYFCPPLSFAKYLRSHNTFYPTTHSESLYPRLKSQKQKGLEENVRLLQQHSSRHMPPWFKFLLNWYIVLAVAAYVLVIPLTAAYTFHPKCLTRSQFLGRLWTVSVIAGVAPPLIGFFVPATMYNLPGAGRSSLISSYTFLLLLWLFHHFVLPYVIFRTCVGDGIYWIILPEFCVAAIILIGIIG